MDPVGKAVALGMAEQQDGKSLELLQLDREEQP